MYSRNRQLLAAEENMHTSGTFDEKQHIDKKRPGRWSAQAFSVCAQRAHVSKGESP